MFNKILVANRGEIAVRVMRACREMGIATVATYSEADRKSPHVRYADEAFLVGPAAANQSYLRMEKIIEAAHLSGAQAIHPGYGFLAENPEFARRVKDAGLVFIGPEPETLRLLGDKLEAKDLAEKAGLPIVPGVDEPLPNGAKALTRARELGFPVLLKAAGGGGGKGMRVVKEPDQVETLFKLAQSEARSAFGDDRIYIEKYLEQPRHIEVQIIGDRFGNIVHLGERECSIQRRHQKVVEESPSPIVDAEMRGRMGAAAVKLAAAARYLNTGTVEFLVDRDKSFYFLEVNARLQVEHPVTEMVTGVDLAREQVRVAEGKPLSFSQSDISLRGSAIECRIYAEDPDNDFVPSIGTIRSYREPGGPGVRVDSGLSRGDEISIFYDPLIAKLISWGKDRQMAIERMRRALEEYIITGVKTIIPFHTRLMNHPLFVAGDFSTHFIAEQNRSLSHPSPPSVQDLEALAALSCAHDFLAQKPGPRRSPSLTDSPWKYQNRRKNILGS